MRFDLFAVVFVEMLSVLSSDTCIAYIIIFGMNCEEGHLVERKWQLAINDDKI